MSCTEWTWRLVDNARRGATPGPLLREHLAECPNCAARWRNEKVLTRELLILSDRVSAGSVQPQRLDVVMREFERQRPMSLWHWLRWAPIAVGALVLILGLWAILRRADQPPAMEVAQTTPSDEGFMAVPYAPPLAQGEFVSVVREDLDPAALVRMGLPVSGLEEGPVTADVLVGEDGFPRAVRVAEETEF